MKYWSAVLVVLVWLVSPVAFGQSVSDSASEAKEKAKQAMDAFTKLVEQMSLDASKRAQDAAEALRGTVQDSVRRACESALQACLKVCDGGKCEQACKSGRAKCQADN